MPELGLKLGQELGPEWARIGSGYCPTGGGIPLFPKAILEHTNCEQVEEKQKEEKKRRKRNPSWYKSYLAFDWLQHTHYINFGKLSQMSVFHKKPQENIEVIFFWSGRGEKQGSFDKLEGE